MAKLIDFISIRIVLFIVISLLLFSSTGGFVLALSAAAVIVIAGSVFYGRFVAPKIKRQALNADKLNKYFLARGNESAAEYIAALIDEKYKAQKIGDFILLDTDTAERAVIYPVFKYSKISKDEFLRMYRNAASQGTKKIYIVSKSLDREIHLVANDLEAAVIFIKIPVLYKYLKNKNALPTLPDKVKKPPKKLSFILAAESIFARKNTKRFLFTAAILLLMSAVTPLKAYYYTMSAIAFCLAIPCFFVSDNVSYSKNGIFAYKKTK
ncbi:MAG: hypothetical protein LBT30_08410 [Clostridiales bacterium]|jgi:hypothetical protein|nr:hypothetical protein [Clostridiales bacterium]